MSTPLNIIAPSFDPATVGGAGAALVELTHEFLRQLPSTKIYLNRGTAKLYPEWSASIVEVPTGSHVGPRPPTSALLKLQFFGSPVLPTDGITWFPFGFMTPSTWRGKGVATIYDTLERDLPHCLPASQRLFRRWIVRRTTREAQIVTASEFSRGQLAHHYGVNATVIPLATIPLPAPTDAKVPPKPFAFFPANAWPHKNHLFLIKTWLEEPRLREIALVFTLSSGLHHLQQSITEARRKGIDIIVTGHITAAELAGLYSAAQCTVFPSLYEGFGLPVQESLSCGCPIIASRSGSLPETVIADYPFLLPLESDAWAEAVLSHPRQLLGDCRRYLSPRTWAACASEYVDLFRTFR